MSEIYRIQAKMNVIITNSSIIGHDSKFEVNCSQWMNDFWVRQLKNGDDNIVDEGMERIVEGKNELINF